MSPAPSERVAEILRDELAEHGVRLPAVTAALVLGLTACGDADGVGTVRRHAGARHCSGQDQFEDGS